MSRKSELKAERKKKQEQSKRPWLCLCDEYDVDESVTLWNGLQQPYHQCNLCGRLKYCGVVMA